MAGDAVSSAMDELATLTADLRAWLSWQEMLGSSSLPRESLLKLPPVEIPAKTAPRVAGTPAPRAVTPTPKVAKKAAPAVAASREPVAVKGPVATPPASPPATPPKGRPLLTEKWKVLMDGPTTHQVTGSIGARLTLVRGSGSSPQAESMLNRMLENVVGLSRDEVCIVDLIRDTRAPSEIGQGFREAVAELKPSLMLVMGTFAVRALFGDEKAVSDLRGAWTQFPCAGGTVALRVTHHPEAILALAARGQSAPKREAFADLKELGQRLT